MKFDDSMAKIKALFKENLTADNTEQITAMDKEVDIMQEEFNKLKEDYSKLQDKYVDIVKNTAFKDVDSNSNDNSEPLSIEDALNKAYLDTKDKFKTKNYK